MSTGTATAGFDPSISLTADRHNRYAKYELWNTLPLSLRDPTLTLTSFCSRLKTHLFSKAYGRALVTA